MPSTTKSTLFYIGAAIARLSLASTVLVFPDSSCNTQGYYDTIDAQEGTCSENFLTDRDFNATTANSSLYKAWFQLQTTEADGCGVVIASNSVDSNAPPCGECTILLHTAGECVEADLPTTYYADECCGSTCQGQCAQIPGKRSIGEDDVDAKATPTLPDIANLKNRSPVASAPKAKRSDCSFSGSKGLYSQAGQPTKVSDTYSTCTSSNGCQESYTGMVESSFSQTFMVGESTEAGLFDIVSETVSFSYSATWEESKSVSVSGSYTFSEGQGGYMTFSPLSQCVDGTFSGSDCEGMGIPTGNSGTACVPEVIAGGQINGDVNVVTSD